MLSNPPVSVSLHDQSALVPFSSPSGMVESTPQLFGNAWRVSSACGSSLMAPQLDPCDTHQQAGRFDSLNLVALLSATLSGPCGDFMTPVWSRSLFLSGLRIRDVRHPEPGRVLRLPRVSQPRRVSPTVPLSHLQVRDALPLFGARPLRPPLPPFLCYHRLSIARSRLW